MRKIRKLLLSVVGVLTIGISATGQSNPQIIPEYPFVRSDSNRIHFFQDTLNYSRLFNKLDSLIFKGKGKVNIMQFGGSHIQADIWSDQMRKHFQQLSPNLNGGRGFLFPFRLAKTNNPYYYEVSYTGNWEGFRSALSRHEATWGVSGITASTYDSIASFKIKFRGDDTPYYDFNRIKIYHDLDQTGYCLELKSDPSATIIENHRFGYTEFLLDKHQDSLEVGIYKTDSLQTHFNLYGLSLENDDQGLVYHSIGVNGASTGSYLRASLFQQHIEDLNPDFVIFCIGINDAFDSNFCPSCYEKNYDALIAQIRKANPDCEFLFVTNSDSYIRRRYPNKRVYQAKEAMVNLAKKYDAGMWDLFEIMGGLGSIKTWEAHNLAKRDRIHFTGEGYKLLGDLMFAALMGEYERHLKSTNASSAKP
jgi:lysophospholipase L1-like esterase